MKPAINQSQSPNSNQPQVDHNYDSIKPPQTKQNNNLLLTIIIILGFVLTGIGGFYLGTLQNKQVLKHASKAAPTTRPNIVDTANTPTPKQVITTNEIQPAEQPTKTTDKIVVDYDGIDPKDRLYTYDENLTGNLTPEIKQAIETVIESEAHVFTDRKFFTFATYFNYGDEWIKAMISAPENEDYITLQGEPHSQMIMQKTSSGWKGHFACYPGYLQMKVDFYQRGYIEVYPELIETLNSQLANDPNSTDINCKQ